MEKEYSNLLSERNSTTATLLLLNSLHRAFILSEEVEKQLILGAVDVAYQNLCALETVVNELAVKHSSLDVMSSFTERVGVLKDVISVETEKLWGKLVMFSEEGDVQLTIYKEFICI